MLVDIKPRIVKPSFGSVQIDWGHPLSRGLVGVWLHSEGAGPIINLARPTPATMNFTSGLKWVSSVKGLGLSYDGTNVDHVTFGDALDPFTDQSIVAMGIPTTLAGDQRVFVNKQAAYRLYFNGGAPPKAEYSPATGDISGATTITVNTAYHVVGTTSQAFARTQIYLQGVLDGSQTGVSPGIPDNTNTLEFGRVSAFGGFGNFIGTISQILMYTRELTASEVLWLFAEPYAFLNPVPRVRYWLTPPAAAAPAGSQVSPRSLALLGVGS